MNIRDHLLTQNLYPSEPKHADTAVMDKMEELFLEDVDTLNALSSWIRGHFSTNELVDRLEFLKILSQERAVEALDEMGPDDPWEAA